MAHISRKEYFAVQSKRKKRKKSRVIKIIFSIFLTLFLISGGVLLYSYYHVSKTFNALQSKSEVELKEVVDVRKEDVKVGHDSISILMLGLDTGEFERTDNGRPDIVLVLTLNPKTKKGIMTSIPRDTYTELVGRGEKDKINHAYAYGGISMMINSVQKLLDIPIDYYVTVDMGGFTEIINLIGGITLTPLETFEQEGYFFVEGESQDMDGSTALQYIRNRYTEKGDYGRQERARQVLGAIAEKVVNVNAIANLGSYMSVVEKYVGTNVKLGDVQSMLGDVPAILKNLNILQLKGAPLMLNDIYYEQINEDSLLSVKNQLRENLEIE
ncbi:LCP family protein [Aerococcaceae bacterium zg-ZUI334]|uniref:LCP family glycopolymer transferase n=1 Tax=Aerococcaceae TaxID=186827 RepID=UPI0013B76927|nr:MULTISPECIES: LCP family protein [unclassified Facklamia]MBR7927756.1 LCP family protein [Aerococcaceae bacterium zg-ZUI334]MBS4462095.1 LCP family protein [Aerococcaceae bacterium zg-B36]QQD65741.1 LCP family protein [Aerococcaceae bacterium zg-252]NEW64559.1 transcriptional regulator [Facklamia sp. 252]NEW67766.1 transcriptional regulator [Facklamia sp. 253]